VIILRDEKLALCGLCPTYQFGVTGSSPCTSHRSCHATGAHHILVSLAKRQHVHILDVSQTIYMIDTSSPYFVVITATSCYSRIYVCYLLPNS